MNFPVEQYLIRLQNDLKISSLFEVVSPHHFKIQIPNFCCIELKKMEQNLIFFSQIGRIIEHLDEEKLFAYLLQANFLGQGTGNSVIGLHPDEKTIVLISSFFSEVNYPDFKEHLEEMVNYIDYLTEHLASKMTTFLRPL